MRRCLLPALAMTALLALCTFGCRTATQPRPTPRVVIVVVTSALGPPAAALASPTPSATPSAAATPTPSGPAAGVVASMPNPIECERWEEDKCWWNYAVTFNEFWGVAATIERVGQRYVDREGHVWMARSGEWSDVHIALPPRGTDTFHSWVRDRQGYLMGGTVTVSYAGHDANGNPFTGRVAATLAWAAWPTHTPAVTPTAAP